MSNELIVKKTIDQMPEAEQVVAVARELYRGAGKLNMSVDPATAQKVLFPIAKELLRDFAGIFELCDVKDAFDAAVRHEIPVAVNHYGKMSLEFAYSVLNAWRGVKWSRAALTHRAMEAQQAADEKKRWERDRLTRLAAVFNAIKEGRPVTIDPASMLATHIAGRLEAIGVRCAKSEQLRVLTDLVKTKGLTLNKFLGRLLPAAAKPINN